MTVVLSIISFVLGYLASKYLRYRGQSIRQLRAEYFTAAELYQKDSAEELWHECCRNQAWTLYTREYFLTMKAIAEERVKRDERKALDTELASL